MFRAQQNRHHAENQLSAGMETWNFWIMTWVPSGYVKIAMENDHL